MIHPEEMVKEESMKQIPQIHRDVPCTFYDVDNYGFPQILVICDVYSYYQTLNYILDIENS